MKKLFMSLVAIGVLAFGIVFSPAIGQTVLISQETEQQNLPILPPI